MYVYVITSDSDIVLGPVIGVEGTLDEAKRIGHLHALRHKSDDYRLAEWARDEKALEWQLQYGKDSAVKIARWKVNTVELSQL